MKQKDNIEQRVNELTQVLENVEFIEKLILEMEYLPNEEDQQDQSDNEDCDLINPIDTSNK